MKAIIIDNNAKFCDIIERMIEEICITLKFSIAIDKAEDMQCIFDSGKIYDIYFISINEEERKQITFVKSLRKRSGNGEIVFIGERDGELKNVLCVKPCAFVMRKSLREDLKEALSLLKNMLYKKDLIAISNARKVYEYEVGTIQYFKSEGHYVDVCLENDNKDIIRCKMETIEKALSGHRFIRIHERYLVNYYLIDDYKNNKVYLKSGEILPVSRNYSKWVRSLDHIK